MWTLIGGLRGALVAAVAAAAAFAVAMLIANLWLIPAAEREARAALRAEIAEATVESIARDDERDRRHEKETRDATDRDLQCELDPTACDGVR